jgi:hypothetical protein
VDRALHLASRKTFLHDFGGTNPLQISGELACLRASLKESHVATGTKQTQERTLRAVQTREISVNIFQTFGWSRVGILRHNDKRPDMQRRERADNFLAVLAGAE